MIEEYDPLASVISRPPRPTEMPATAYPNVQMTEFIPYESLLSQVPQSHRVQSSVPLPMERLGVNNGNGQSYGYVVYRTSMAVSTGSTITVRGNARDLLQVIVNGVMINDPIISIADLNKFGSWAPR